MSSHALHASLLRPAIIHILRAAGFHATKPSVVDALTDVCARYMLLIASRSAAFAHDRTVTQLKDIEMEASIIIERDHDQSPQLTPTIADVRNGLTSAAFFSHGLSASEEAWTEVMRKPLTAYSASARDKERRGRDLEDTQDVREFVEWATGPVAKEIRRVAGLLPDERHNTLVPAVPLPPLPAVDSAQPRDDYLDTLKKKQSKSGDSARYNGSVLGKNHDDHRLVRIEGGPSSLSEWKANLKRKRNPSEA